MKTTIDLERGDQPIVSMPVEMTLEWFDHLRNGVVGIIRLCPTDDRSAWTLTYQDAPVIRPESPQQ